MAETGTATLLRKEGKNIAQLIVFALGDEEFSIRIAEVREIIMTGIVTPVPDAPDFVQGVSNVRGEIAAIIDLRRRFSLPEAEDVHSKYIIITQQGKNLFGLLVDELVEVLRIEETDIKEAPRVVTKVHGEYIQGVIPMEKRLIIMLDLSLVLSEKDLEELAELHRTHGDRGVEVAETHLSEKTREGDTDE
jgi:purine-binding chemotaxis protein CheW